MGARWLLNLAPQLTRTKSFLTVITHYFQALLQATGMVTETTMYVSHCPHSYVHKVFKNL
jgi:hypothetical protein